MAFEPRPKGSEDTYKSNGLLEMSLLAGGSVLGMVRISKEADAAGAEGTRGRRAGGQGTQACRPQYRV